MASAYMTVCRSPDLGLILRVPQKDSFGLSFAQAGNCSNNRGIQSELGSARNRFSDVPEDTATTHTPDPVTLLQRIFSQKNWSLARSTNSPNAVTKKLSKMGCFLGYCTPVKVGSWRKSKVGFLGKLAVARKQGER